MLASKLVLEKQNVYFTYVDPATGSKSKYEMPNMAMNRTRRQLETWTMALSQNIPKSRVLIANSSSAHLICKIKSQLAEAKCNLVKKDAKKKEHPTKKQTIKKKAFSLASRLAADVPTRPSVGKTPRASFSLPGKMPRFPISGPSKRYRRRSIDRGKMQVVEKSAFKMFFPRFVQQQTECNIIYEKLKKANTPISRKTIQNAIVEPCDFLKEKFDPTVAKKPLSIIRAKTTLPVKLL
jgi:hypothetical protein